MLNKSNMSLSRHYAKSTKWLWNQPLKCMFVYKDILSDLQLSILGVLGKIPVKACKHHGEALWKSRQHKQSGVFSNDVTAIHIMQVIILLHC